MSMSTYAFLNSLEMPFLQVEEGTFWQGAISYDHLARENEKPAAAAPQSGHEK